VVIHQVFKPEQPLLAPLRRRTMPHVSFTPATTVSRPPTASEMSVMHKFARHCSHCLACEDPYTSFRISAPLCARGIERALVVNKYVFTRNGKAYSVGTHEDGYEQVRVEVPARYEAVRGLLRAVEEGLRLKQPVITAADEEIKYSYDRTYYVPERVYERPYNAQEPRLGRKRERRYHEESPRQRPAAEREYYDARFHR